MIDTSFRLAATYGCPRAPGPDDTSDPDFPDRDHHRDGGPDDTRDPDDHHRDNGDTFNGPDGPYSYPEYL